MIQVKKGDRLLSKSGDWHEVLKVIGEGYVQSTNGVFSIQSRNEPKAAQRIYMFDGHFLAIRSIEEVEKLYLEVDSVEKREEVDVCSLTEEALQKHGYFPDGEKDLEDFVAIVVDLIRSRKGD